MLCRDFEDRLEGLVAGVLGAAEAGRCREHAAACAGCADLLALATLDQAPVGMPPDLLRQVLGQTSGPACAAAAELLCDWADGPVGGADGILIERHLGGCPDCRGLLAALAGLRRDLPRLAVLRPDERFVADVLRRTLPPGVRLRRWWRSAWPRWVHRPRFASEAAFIGLLALVLVFATPGSPLEAVPRQALTLAQEPPVEAGELLDAPLRVLEEGAATVAENVRESETARAVVARYESAAAVGERFVRLARTAGERLGTFWSEVASLLEKGERQPATGTEDPIEETS